MAELGQILFHNQPIYHETPAFADALLVAIQHRLGIAFWNVHQKTWAGEHWDGTWGELPPGIEWRNYWWGDDNAPEVQLPNFSFEGVEIRWYKHPGRSNNANVVWTPAEWARWFDRCLQTIDRWEYENCPSLQIGRLSIPTWPDPMGTVPLSPRHEGGKVDG